MQQNNPFQTCQNQTQAAVAFSVLFWHLIIEKKRLNMSAFEPEVQPQSNAMLNQSIEFNLSSQVATIQAKKRLAAWARGESYTLQKLQEKIDLQNWRITKKLSDSLQNIRKGSLEDSVSQTCSEV